MVDAEKLLPIKTTIPEDGVIPDLIQDLKKRFNTKCSKVQLILIRVTYLLEDAKHWWVVNLQPYLLPNNFSISERLSST